MAFPAKSGWEFLEVFDRYGPQAIWGRELRHYRRAAGLTQSQLSDLINFSESLISGVETGQIPASAEFAEMCDKVLKTGGALTRQLDYRNAPGFPSWFDWPKYESEAVVLRTFQLSVVYGLLQTRDYADTLLYGEEAAVTARMARQAILTRERPAPPRLVCLLDEAVLHHDVGGFEVMRAQLARLVASVSARLSVQIVPNGVVHPGNAGAFVVGTLDDGREVAYVEGATRGRTTGDPDELRMLNASFDTIRSQALPVNMSIDLINRTAEQRWTP